MSNSFDGKRARTNGGMQSRQNNSLMQVEDPAKLEAKRRLLEAKHLEQLEQDLDADFGYTRYTTGPSLTGFIFNLNVISLPENNAESKSTSPQTISAVEFYLVRDDGSTFKAVCHTRPYFLVRVEADVTVPELEEWVARRFEGQVKSVELINKEDLNLPNHLSGLQQPYMKFSFNNTDDLNAVRRVIMSAVAANERYAESTNLLQAGSAILSGKSAQFSSSTTSKRSHFQTKTYAMQSEEIMSKFLDIREHDLPYSQRLLIETSVRVGKWYDIEPIPGTELCTFKLREDLVERPLMKVMAWDIETSKSPLKFPNAEVDPIIMFSLMLDGIGLLLVNREIVSADINSFEYTPKPEYEGVFEVINCKNEKDMIVEFFKFTKKHSPQIHVTYNGDFFDWPYVEKRASIHGMNMLYEIGIWYDEPNGEFKGRFSIHLDAFAWVKRDSYLPQGSQGLKAVTKAKLKYDPIELDPEEMLPYALERPQVLASYSVSDAVATYYLYMKYIHLFIFSLCMIIPMPPNDVLRKGSGTLCEMLLLVEAHINNVVAPNKQMEKHIRFHNGHLLESETYIGGHVECLNSGIYRSDIPIEFQLNPIYIQKLIDNLDNVIKFTIEEEGGEKIEHCTNIPEIKADIEEKLIKLRDKPVQTISPLIYHLDVGAMYPNIILTNRLQPYAMVNRSICATCDFNAPENDCQRVLPWAWRGKYYVASKSDFTSVKTSLEHEPLTQEDTFKFRAHTFSGLREEEQAIRIKKRLKTYCQRVYKKLTIEEVEERKAMICQREHPFYVDTVRAFRDRRYDYKRLNKTWNQKLAEATDAISQANCKNMILLYDSMQLAHKCILNSFYGYVMRKGSRWGSMEMAGVVTKTGAVLIQEAEKLVQAVGKVLELDTDGIWCLLPLGFPDNYTFQCKNPTNGAIKKVSMNYPCSVLNANVNQNFTNTQYQTLVDEKRRSYKKSSECSIFFEVDGPYKAMVLPASQHEGKNIKKRYAVFNHDDSLAELKGFEIKRRGELKIIKIFQGEVFGTFLRGSTLQECYTHVGIICDRWLDVLYSHGRDLEDEDVFDLISENKSMSDTLESYGDARSTSITCARRLGEFLGPEMVKDRGLNCKFIISKLPHGASVSDRAVPVAIFSAEPLVKRHFLRKWLKDGGLRDEELDIRAILDWDYYITRLGSTIQKIVTIPAAFQKIGNPVERVVHPDWLIKTLRVQSEKAKQASMKNYLATTSTLNAFKPLRQKNNVDGDGGDGGDIRDIEDIEDIEDFDGNNSHTKKGVPLSSARQKRLAITRRVIPKGHRQQLQYQNNGQIDQTSEEDHNLDNFDTNISDTFNSMSDHHRRIDVDTLADGTILDGFTSIDAQIAENELGEPPSIDDDFQTWLQWQKKYWKLDRLKTKERIGRITQETVATDTTDADADMSIDMTDMTGVTGDMEVRKQHTPGVIDITNDTSQIYTQNSNNISNTTTNSQTIPVIAHVLQIIPTKENPGIFTLWCYVIEHSYRHGAENTNSGNTSDTTFPSRLLRVNILIPRQFYLNSRNALGESENCVRVDKILPRMRTCRNLYQLTMTEGEFLESREEIEQFQNSPDVDGVFETRIPLIFNAISSLGTTICLQIPIDMYYKRTKSSKSTKNTEMLIPHSITSIISNIQRHTFTPDHITVITQDEAHDINPKSGKYLSLIPQSMYTKPTSSSLPMTVAPFIRVYFYHQAVDHGRHIFALLPLLPPAASSIHAAQSYIQRGVVLLVGPGADIRASNASSLLTQAFSSFYDDIIIADGDAQAEDIKSQRASGGDNDNNDEIDDVNSTYVSNARSAEADLHLGQTPDLSARGYEMRRLLANILHREYKSNQYSTMVQSQSELEDKKIDEERDYEEDNHELIEEIDSELGTKLESDKSLDESTPTSTSISTSKSKSISSQSNVSISLELLQNVEDAITYLHQAMIQFKEQSERGGSSVIMLSQTSESPEQLAQVFPAMSSLFPILHLPSDSSPINASTSSTPSTSSASYSFAALTSLTTFSLPILQWGSIALERVYQKFLTSHYLWSKYAPLSTFSQIPLANITGCSSSLLMPIVSSKEVPNPQYIISTNSSITPPQVQSDPMVFVLDVLFARNLRLSGHILWISPDLLPDLGGVQEQDSLYRALDDEYSNPEVCISGCYREVCVEVSLELFAMNAILAHAPLTETTLGISSLYNDTIEQKENDSESGSNGKGGNDGNDGSGIVNINATNTELFSTSSTSLSFHALRSLVISLVQHIELGRSVSSASLSTLAAANAAHVVLKDVEEILSSICRWIQSNDSLLYDPLIHRYTRDLIRNSFTHFIARLTKLKCKPIYATYTKIIVPTGRISPSRSIAFIRYILDTISSRSEYSILQMHVAKVYNSLLFLDNVNYSYVEQVDSTIGTGSRALIDSTSTSTSVASLEDAYIAKKDENEDKSLVIYSSWHIAKYLPPIAQQALLSLISDYLIIPTSYLLQLEAEGNITTSVERNSRMQEYVTDLLENSIQAKALEYIDAVRIPDDNICCENIPPGYIYGEALELYHQQQQQLRQQDTRIYDTEDDGSSDDETRKNNNDGNDTSPDSDDSEYDVDGEDLSRRIRNSQHKKHRRTAANKFDKYQNESDDDDNDHDNKNGSSFQDDDNFVVDDMFDGSYTTSTTSQNKKGKNNKNGSENGDITTVIPSFSPSFLLDNHQDLLTLQVNPRALFPNSPIYNGITRYPSYVYTIPLLPGAKPNDNDKDQGVEFAKIVAYVFTLENVVRNIGQKIRENLLLKACGPSAQLFSQELYFKDPCSTYILPDIVCASCSHTRDLDVCRDENLIPKNYATNTPIMWTCVMCNEFYDRRKLEAMLLAVLRRREMYYQVQDLFCQKCANIRQDALSTICKCTADYVLAKSRAIFLKQLHILHDISIYCDFYSLRYRIEWMLHTTK